MKISHLTDAVINSGVTPQLKIEEAQIVRLTNLFGMIPMVFFAIYIVNGVVYDIDFFWKTSLVNMAFNTLAILCNYRGFYALSKTILLAANSVILFLFVNVVEGNSSAVAFFFPVLSCYVVFYDVMRELRVVLVNLAITSLCILLCLLLPQHMLGHVTLPPYMSGNITRMNYLLAFTAFAFYVFTIIKVKLQSETLLIQAMQTAEIMANKSDVVVNQLTVQKDKAEEAVKTRETFLAEMSEEITGPLKEISQATELVAEKEISREISPELDRLHGAAAAIMETITDVQELQKINSGKVKAERNIFRVDELLTKIQEACSTQHDAATVHVDIDEESRREVITDEKRLHQLLKLLVTKLLRTTDAGEMTIIVKGESIRKDNMTLAFTLCRSVNERDNPGEAAMQHGQEFRLALCERLAAHLGGKVIISSSGSNKSATFHIPVKRIATDTR